jgi:hypothetical protein
MPTRSGDLEFNKPKPIIYWHLRTPVRGSKADTKRATLGMASWPVTFSGGFSARCCFFVLDFSIIHLRVGAQLHARETRWRRGEVEHEKYRAIRKHPVWCIC